MAFNRCRKKTVACAYSRTYNVTNRKELVVCVTTSVDLRVSERSQAQSVRFQLYDTLEKANDRKGDRSVFK